MAYCMVIALWLRPHGPLRNELRKEMHFQNKRNAEVDYIRGYLSKPFFSVGRNSCDFLSSGS